MIFSLATRLLFTEDTTSKCYAHTIVHLFHTAPLTVSVVYQIDLFPQFSSVLSLPKPLENETQEAPCYFYCYKAMLKILRHAVPRVHFIALTQHFL
jgi:hypothetical protein